jgi:energy-coupling factor transporter ATP-binding protein EcfA2
MDFNTDELLYYIGKADGSDYVCIDLMPSGLSIKDVEQLKIGVTERDIIDMQSCNAYYNTILTHPKKLLLAQVTLFTADEIPHNNYKNAIKQTFFGKNTNATWTNVTQNDCNFSVEPEFPRGRLAFTYTLNSINSVARLPMPADFSRKQIAMLGKSFEQLPESLSDDGILIGEKRYSASKTDIFIDEEALFRHLYILGQTGTGKSTLIKSMALDVIQKGHGCCVIDPHGDLFEDIIKNIPEHRRDDICIFDTNNLENSLKLNLIHYNIHAEKDKSKVIQTIIQSLNQSYNMQTNAGFMFELFLRAAIFLGLEDSTTQELGRKANLSDVQQIVDTELIRKKLLSLTKNDSLLKTFKQVEEMTGEQSWSNFIPYINSKLSVFTENAYINTLFNAQESTLNFRKIMDEKKILLVRFDKGQIGFGNLHLVGNLFFSLFVNDIMGRSELRREDRTNFFVFVDEFQNFLNQHISDALAEVRKYNISLTLANQSLGQLSDNVYQSLLGNVGNTIFFRPGNNDYEKIKHFLEPDFDRSEVLKLPNFNCFVKLLINNIPSEPFVMQTKQV